MVFCRDVQLPWKYSIFEPINTHTHTYTRTHTHVIPDLVSKRQRIHPSNVPITTNCILFHVSVLCDEIVQEKFLWLFLVCLNSGQTYSIKPVKLRYFELFYKTMSMFMFMSKPNLFITHSATIVLSSQFLHRRHEQILEQILVNNNCLHRSCCCCCCSGEFVVIIFTESK